MVLPWRELCLGYWEEDPTSPALWGAAGEGGDAILHMQSAKA